MLECVFLLYESYGEPEAPLVVGVYSTLAKAQEILAKLEVLHPSRPGYFIEEVKLDNLIYQEDQLSASECG